MLFSEEEIKNLVLFKSTAININKIYEVILKLSDQDVNYKEFFVDSGRYFNDLKNNIFYLEKNFYSADSILENTKYHISILDQKLEKIFLNLVDYGGMWVRAISQVFYDFLGDLIYNNKKYVGLGYEPQYKRGVLKDFYINMRDYIEKYNNSNDLTVDKKILFLEEKISFLNIKIDAENLIIRNENNEYIKKRAEQFAEESNKIIYEYQTELSKIHAQFLVSINDQAEKLKNSIKTVDQDFQLTYKDYELLKKMVQGKGEQEVTNHYKNKANWERFTYWFMTTLTFIIIGGAICLATLSLNDYKTKTSINIDEWSQKLKNQPIEKIEKIYELQQKNALIYLILRLVISIFLFSSIIYTSRIAYRAYVHMRHSENMRLKLATLRPFINQLKEDERNQIHKDLVPDYFGKDAGMVDSSNEKFKDLPANVSAVAMKAIEQISGSSNSSGTEKNNKKPESETG